MVRHQAISPDLGSGLARSDGQQIAIKDEVAVLEKSLLPAVTALRDMKRDAGNDDACKPGQTASDPERSES
jgi:hypothetical protein